MHLNRTTDASSRGALRYRTAVLVLALGGVAGSGKAIGTGGPDQAPNPSEVRCFDEIYAPTKSGATVAPMSPGKSVARDEAEPNDGAILISSVPLRFPPEVARIRRGLITHFVGTLINEGRESWSAVDLDRHLAIDVSRHVYDVQSKATHPVRDPTFPEHTLGHIFARKFSTPERTEIEVISTIDLDADDLEVFVCVANAAWAAAPEKPETISDGFLDYSLRDTRSQERELLNFSKSINYIGPLHAALRHVWDGDLPQPKW